MRMCERRKIANAYSVLTNDALTWCESVYVMINLELGVI